MFKPIYRFLSQLLFKDFNIKLLSLVLTIILWATITGGKIEEAQIPLYLEYLTTTGYTVANAPKKITIKIKGPKAFISEFKNKSFSYTIDLRNKETGYIKYYIPPKIFHFPIGVKLLSISPNPISPKIEKLASKNVTIQASLVNNLPDGYKIKTLKITPDSVEIFGPKSTIDTIKELYTKPIDISKIRSSTTIETQIDPKFVKLFPFLANKKISVYLDVSPIVVSKIIRSILVYVKGGENKQYKLNPKYIDIALKGPKNTLKNLTAYDIRAEIDITFNSIGNYKEEVKIQNLPNDVYILSINPSKVSVWIYKIK